MREVDDGIALVRAAVESVEGREQTQAVFGGHRYRVERVLGSGGQKIVYLVYDTELDRRCALSLINSEGLDERGMRQLREEARAVARLGGHPNLVTIFDIGDHRGQPFVVAEYLPGGDLRQELVGAGGRLQIPRALAVVDQILGALDFAHGQRLVHRDIKPENIWLTSDRRAKLGDFGLALTPHAKSLHDSGMVAGTPSYMSPEQVRGGRGEERSDLYSIGCMLFELVTGTPPFTGTVISVLGQHLTAPIPSARKINPAVSGELDQLLRDLLSKDPDGRPPSAVQARRRLAHAMLEPAPTDEDAAAPERTSTGLARFSHLRFVGREREMQKLRKLWREALGGSGRLVIVSGAAGIGKSRLVRELELEVRAGRSELLQGRCAADGGAPYLPFVEALEPPLKRAQRGGTDVLSTYAPVLSRLLPQLALRLGEVPSKESEGPGDRMALFEAVAQVLRALGDAGGVLFTLEDLHWAAAPALLLLNHLVRQIGDMRVLIVATVREQSDGQGVAVGQSHVSLRTQDNVKWLSLEGLGEKEVAEIIEGSGSGHLPEPLIGALCTQTDGNPLFVGELLRYLADRKHSLADIEFDSARPLLAQIGIPESIRAVIDGRLARLSDDCHRMLRSAAVLGERFRWDILLPVTGTTEDGLLDVLDEALRAQVIQEVGTEGGGLFAFTHDLLRQSLYTELSAPRRMRLHRRIADALAAQLGDDEAHVDEIAAHYYEASSSGSVDEAVRFGLRAASLTRAAFGFEAAVRHYERVLTLTANDPDTWLQERIRAFDGRGGALGAIGQWRDARADFDEALALVGTDEPKRRIRLLLRSAQAYHWSLDALTSFKRATEARALAVESKDQVAEARALVWMATGPASDGDLPLAIELFEEATEMAPTEDLRQRGFHAATLYWCGRLDDSRVLAEGHLQAAIDQGDPGEQVFALSQLGLAEMGRGRFDAALEALTRMRQIGERYGTRSYLARGLAITGGLYNLVRDYDRARETSLEAQEMARSLAFTPPIVSAAFDIVHGYLRQGEVGKADAIMSTLPEQMRSMGGFHAWIWRLRLALARAEMGLVRGEWDDALAGADVAIARAIYRPKYEVAGNIARGRALVGLGRHADALAAFDRAVVQARFGENPALLHDALTARLACQHDDDLLVEARANIDSLLAQIGNPDLFAKLLTANDVAGILG